MKELSHDVECVCDFSSLTSGIQDEPGLGKPRMGPIMAG
jgi:hypothetical protein